MTTLSFLAQSGTDCTRLIRADYSRLAR